MDNRLKLIAEMVQPCDTAADVGTDHGMLICELVKSGLVKNGTATDINAKPLAKAKAEIIAQGLEASIKAVCTDGLKGIPQQQAVIIAGMGGELIAAIIASWEHAKAGGTMFYLQPMTKPERLRQWLYENGYRILTERCCVAVGRAYVVLQVDYSGEKIDYTPAMLYLGKIDQARGVAQQQYLTAMRRKLATRLGGLVAGGAQPQELQYWQEIIDEADRRLSR